MSTLSTNQIVVEYIIKEGDVLKAKNQFDGLTKAEIDSLNALKKINEQLKANGDQAKKSGDDLIKALGKSDDQVKGFGSSLKGITPLLTAAFSLAAISAFTKQVVETTIKFEGYYKAIEFASGSSQNFARNQEFLSNLIQRYGLDLAQTTEAYKQFFTASTLAGQSQQETNKQFEAVTKAGTVLKLTTDQMQGAFLALGQMMSKGTVQAEELRGQLGERIPGAFSLMAKALNVNERQLNKMLEQGQVLSKDALPAFAAELEKTFGAASQKNLNGMVNSQNRFNSSIDTLILAVGNRLQPFLKGAYDLAAGIANQIARAAGAEKKASTENLGLKKAEAEIAQLILKVSQDQGVWIDRKKAATQLLFDIQNQLDKAYIERGNARINADKLAEKRAERKIDLLGDEEVALTKIAGVEVFSAKKKQELTEQEIKALEDAEKKRMKIIQDEYNAKLRVLELDRKIAEIRIQLATEEGFDRDIKILKNTKDFGEKRLAIDREFAEKGLTEAKENSRLQVEVVKKQEDDIIEEYKREGKEIAKITNDIKSERDKQLLDNAEFAAKQEIQRQKNLLKESNYQKEIVKLYKERDDAIKEIDKKSKEEKKQLETDLKEITNQENEAYAAVAGQYADLITQRRLDNFNREYNALQRNYQAELRLAGGNVQKIAELDEKRMAKEKELRIKEFKAQQTNAIAQVVFKTAPIIAEYFASGVLAPAAIAALAVAAGQIAFISTQQVPEFAEGTKGKPFKGGKAIVGEIGKEWVVTTSGQVYETPGVATLVDLPKGSQVIPNKEVMKAERFMGSKMMGQSRGDSGNGQLVERLISIENTLSKLPITSLTMDERGFTKKIQTKSRETTILNNRFSS